MSQTSEALQPALLRREVLRRGVGAATRVTTAVALTATGAVVGHLGHQARVRDAALKAAAPAVVVVPAPVSRPVRTVVVRAPAAPALASVQRSVQPAVRTSAPRGRVAASQGSPRRTAAAPRTTKAPRATKAPAVTKTSGS